MKIYSPLITGSISVNNVNVTNVTNVAGFASTGSNQFNGNQSISGSITSNGTITAQTLVVQTVTSSVEFVTGSTKNGSLLSNTHQFTGSVLMTGSLDIIGGEFKAGKIGGDEGGQINFGRASDNATAWYIDAYGGAASPQLRFVDATATAVRMTLTGSNVGIGTTSPSHNLSVRGSNATDMISWTDAINNTGYLGIRGGGVVWMNADNNLVLATSNTERMRIGSGGGLVVATNNSGTVRSSIGEGTLELVRASSNTVQAGSYLQFTDPSNARYWVLQQDASFNWATWHYNGGWAKVGYQTPAGTWTNSDIRRKKDFENINYGLSEVLQLNPQKYRFIKQTEEEQKSLGFIAQEVLQIVPEAVQSDMDGEEQYYAMNYSNLVPVLVKAIQELKAEIDTLKNQ